MAILNNNPLIGSGGQQGYSINNSLRFRSSASAYLNRTFGTGSGTISTFSAWVKRGTLGSVAPIMFVSPNGTEDAGLQFDGNNNLSFSSWNGAGGRPLGQLITTQVFRDPSAWYHIVLAIDTTQATSSNRLKLYVNGNQVTAFGTATYPSQNATHYWNLAYEHRLGRYAAAAGTNYIDGYMAEVNFIGGQALTPSSFGETDTTTGVWKPKAYSGTYGTNGFYLKFSDIATTSGSNAGLGKDFSGNGNYWTTNNISVTAGTTYDAMTDSPTNTSATVANYATLNPLWKGSNLTLAGANLNITSTGNGGTAISTIAMESGKYYCEVNINTGSDGTIIGIVNSVFNPSLSSPTLSGANAVGYIGVGGDKFLNGTQTAYGASYTTGDIIGIALDITAGTVTFYKNNTSQGAITHGLTGPFYYATSDASSGSNIDQSWNFGQRPFSYTPPTGYVALNTYNLPTPTILQGNKYMDATAYTGNGVNRSIANGGSFLPDLLWIKKRNSAFNHRLNNTITGTSATLFTNNTDAETTWGGVDAFLSAGFSVSNDSSTNANGDTYVAWQWNAGNNTTSSNTSGSITSTVSVNTTAGFSVVTYTGNGSASQSIGHGLGVAPKWIIVKARSNGVYSWGVYHVTQGNTKYALLNTTDAFATSAQIWASTTPTSSVFYVGSDLGTNKSGDTYVAYCWAAISGFSAFGSYEGNASSDGPMIYLGFRPKFVLIKRSSVAGNDWVIRDSSRDTYNTTNLNLYANLSDAEASGSVNIDFLSNGFKLRGSGVGANGSGTYIYAAFATNPFRNSNAF